MRISDGALLVLTLLALSYGECLPDMHRCSRVDNPMLTLQNECPGTLLHQKPYIRVVDDVLSAVDCSHIIAVAQGRMKVACHCFPLVTASNSRGQWWGLAGKPTQIGQI
jgi:hypothetical protein